MSDTERIALQDRERHPPGTIAFDLDGTLVDSRGGIVEAVQAGVVDTLRRHGADSAAPTETAIVGALGQPANEFFRSLLPQDLQHLAAEAQERSTAHEVDALRGGRVTLFPGTLDALRRLHAQGRSLALISNAQRGYFDAAIESLGLAPLFHFRSCHDDLEARERAHGKRALLGRALHALERPAVMVGDRRDDFEAAASHGCLSVGLRCGFGAAEEIAAADHVLDSVAQLSALLEGIGR